jgi:integrase
MIQPHFNLKDPESTSPTLIYIILRYHGKKFKISAEKSVTPKYWNKRTERVKENKEVSDHAKINESLDKLETILKAAYDFYDKDSIIPEVESLKAKYNEIVLEPKKLNSTKTIWDYFDEFVEYQKGRILLRSAMDYDKALRKHLKETEERFNIPLSFNALRSSGNFIDKMDLYLTRYAKNADGGKGFSLNAKGKQMKNIKSFLNWCFMKEYCPPFVLKHIVKYAEEVDNIYLTPTEIDSLYNLPLIDLIEIETRDLFIVGCETGLRYSDFSRIKIEHIGNNMINIYQTKVRSKVTIPISARLRDILEKYEYNLPQRTDKGLTDFNEKVREIGKQAGINDRIVIQQTRGLKTEEKFFKKYELMSSHTCRRSFCTNKFLKGVPVKVIMAISGHKTEKSFMKYLKLNNEEIVTAFSEQLIAI